MLKHVGEDDKPTSAAKLSMKEVNDSCPADYFAVAKALTVPSQPKSIGDSLGIRKEVLPTKKCHANEKWTSASPKLCSCTKMRMGIMQSCAKNMGKPLRERILQRAYFNFICS